MGRITAASMSCSDPRSVNGANMVSKGYSMMETIGEVSSMLGFVRGPQHRVGAAAFLFSKNRKRIRINCILSILNVKLEILGITAPQYILRIFPLYGRVLLG